MCLRVILIIIALLIWSNAKSQNDQDEKRQKLNAISVSIEVGAGDGPARLNDLYMSLYNQVEFKNKPYMGYSIDYSRQFPIKLNGSLVTGVGISNAWFYHGFEFTNVESTGNPDPKPYLLADGRNGLISLDIPVYYKHQIRTSGISISPFVGLTTKTVTYIGYEERNADIGYGLHIQDDNGTIYRNSVQLDFGMYAGRSVFLGTVGLEFSKGKKNGKYFSLFMSYNHTLFNHVETYVSELENEENGLNYYYGNDKVFIRQSLTNLKFGVSWIWGD